MSGGLGHLGQLSHRGRATLAVRVRPAEAQSSVQLVSTWHHAMPPQLDALALLAKAGSKEFVRDVVAELYRLRELLGAGLGEQGQRLQRRRHPGRALRSRPALLARRPRPRPRGAQGAFGLHALHLTALASEGTEGQQLSPPGFMIPLLLDS